LNFIVKGIAILNFNKVFRNFISLSVSQVLGLLLPLITYPYLIRVIGISNFGKIGFVLSIFTFIFMAVDFGYSYIAPKEVALSLNEPSQLNIVFNRVQFTKLTILISLLILMTILVSIFFKGERYLIFLGYIYVLGVSMTPNWFFQGIEKMHFITFIDTISKVLVTILIFVIIKDKNHYIFYIPILGIGSLISCLSGFILIKREYDINILMPSFNIIFGELVKGFPIFLAQISTYLFTNTNILLIGTFLGSFYAGIYSIAEKAARIPWTFCSIFSTVLYPSICNQTKIGLDSVWKLIKKYIYWFYSLVGLLITVVYILNYYIIEYFTKDNVVEIVYLFNLLLFSTIFIAIGTPYNLILLAYSINRPYMKIFLRIALINIILGTSLIYSFGIYGAGYSHLLTMIILYILLRHTYSNTLKHEIEKVRETFIL